MTTQDIESIVWRCAYDTFGRQRFQKVLLEGLAGFKRLPGLDRCVRIHAGDIGQPGVGLLREALQAYNLASACDKPHYVTVRSRLKAHLTYLLQSQLIATENPSEAILEHHLVVDLGL